MRAMLRFAALLALAGTVAGCSTTVEPTVACDFTPVIKAMKAPRGPDTMVATVPGSLTPIALNTVSITDLGISNKVLVQSVSAARTATGTVEVALRLVNCTDYPLQVEGRTQFLTETQANAEPQSSWQRVYLPPRTLGIYQEKSIATKTVATFLIDVREGR